MKELLKLLGFLGLVGTLVLGTHFFNGLPPAATVGSDAYWVQSESTVRGFFFLAGLLVISLGLIVASLWPRRKRPQPITQAKKPEWLPPLEEDTYEAAYGRSKRLLSFLDGASAEIPKLRISI